MILEIIVGVILGNILTQWIQDVWRGFYDELLGIQRDKKGNIIKFDENGNVID